MRYKMRWGGKPIIASDYEVQYEYAYLSTLHITLSLSLLHHLSVYGAGIIAH